MVSMTTILVRCTLHAQLTHEAFSEWLERRRCDMGGEAEAVRAVEARRLGDRELVVELRCGPGAGDDTERSAVVREFIGDLQLMGMAPKVWVPEPTGRAQLDDASVRVAEMRRTTTMASPNKTMS
jgi:hypothetical protein